MGFPQSSFGPPLFRNDCCDGHGHDGNHAHECLQGEEAGLRRTFAVFYRDRKIADFRHAVVIDGCEAEPYEGLEPSTGSPTPAPAKQASAKP